MKYSSFILTSLISSTIIFAQNLLKNSDFENTDPQTNKIDFWRHAKADNTGYSGKKSALISLKRDANKEKYKIQYISQKIALSAGKYQLSFYVKTVDDGQCFAAWTCVNNHGQPIANKNNWTPTIQTNGKWKKMVRQIEIPQDTKSMVLSIYFRLSGKDIQGQAWIDKVALLPVK